MLIKKLSGLPAAATAKVPTMRRGFFPAANNLRA